MKAAAVLQACPIQAGKFTLRQYRHWPQRQMSEELLCRSRRWQKWDLQSQHFSHALQTSAYVDPLLGVHTKRRFHAVCLPKLQRPAVARTLSMAAANCGYGTCYICVTYAAGWCKCYMPERPRREDIKPVSVLLLRQAAEYHSSWVGQSTIAIESTEL